MAIPKLTELRTGVVADVGALEPWFQAWDGLAVASRRPFCSPSWMVPWWRCVAPRGASLRVVVVTEGEDLVGIAPCFVERAYGGVWRARMLASSASYRTEPLAVPGREAEVGVQVMAALGGSSPPPAVVLLEAVPSGSPWPEAFARAGNGRPLPWRFLDKSVGSPRLSLEGRTYQEWFESKRPHFRQHMRRARRQLGEKGAEVRLVTKSDELPAAVAELAHLHRGRWERRGGPNLFGGRMERMLVAVGQELMAGERFRLVKVEAGGRSVSSHLFLAAGGEVSYWLGGFDQAWGVLSPSMVAILFAIEHAWTLGDSGFDLGGGEQPYKYRFADGEESLKWWTMVPRGPGYLGTRLRLVPKQAYRELARRLPSNVKEQLRKQLRIPDRLARWAR
jgi:CelD/BcsL family acetyltransferase involved in cellulose biosynthesis